MNELINMLKQTPIEIALGIDGNGMTTAKKLYEFLELNPKNYSRWCDVNISKNEFAEENIDYEVFVLKEENLQGGRPTQDYKLTAAFAKKLSMTAKNEKGEQAREYFIKTEDKLKEIAINTSELSPELQMFQKIFNSVAQQELRNKQIEQKADKALETSQAIRDTIIATYDNWRAEIKHLISSIHNGCVKKGDSKTYQDTYNLLYGELEKRAHCDLSTRIDHARFRLQESGATKTTINGYCRMDAIENDPRIKEIFTTIVKEYVIKYSI